MIALDFKTVQSQLPYILGTSVDHSPFAATKYLLFHVANNVDEEEFDQLQDALSEPALCYDLRYKDGQIVIVEVAEAHHDCVCMIINSEIAIFNRSILGKPISCGGQGKMSGMRAAGARADRQPDGQWSLKDSALETRLVLETSNSESLQSGFESKDEYFRCVDSVRAVILVKLGPVRTSSSAVSLLAVICYAPRHFPDIATRPQDQVISFGDCMLESDLIEVINNNLGPANGARWGLGLASGSAVCHAAGMTGYQLIIDKRVFGIEADIPIDLYAVKEEVLNFMFAALPTATP